MRFTHRTGLAVELYEDRGAGSVAICWTYKSGFRDDPAGLAGLVHVGEHLVFEQGTTDSSGSVEHRAACQGIIAGAKTMPNCTQITFLCDAADVLAALELHLPGRPLGGEQAYLSAISAVEAEVRDSLARHQGRRESWVDLSQSLYREWSLSHDGFGYGVKELRGAYGDVHDFLASAFSASNCVLTVTGDFRSSDVINHLDGIELPVYSQSCAGADREIQPIQRHKPSEQKAAGPAGAILPGPELSLADYMAVWFAVEALKICLPDIDMSLGFFGPLRSRSPETLVMSDRMGRVIDIHHVRAMVSRLLTATDDEIREARRHLQFAMHHEFSGHQGRTSTLGRLTALCGPGTGDRALRAAFDSLGPAQLCRGARLLVESLDHQQSKSGNSA